VSGQIHTDYDHESIDEDVQSFDLYVVSDHHEGTRKDHHQGLGQFDWSEMVSFV
jgi:hypothetical protein